MQTKIVTASTLGLGTIFGFLLVSVGATNFNTQANMFLFKDFQLPIVLAVAMMTGVVGVWMIRRMGATCIIKQQTIEYIKTPFSKQLIMGSVFFGVGWALTASCPGTAVAMLGEGKLIGVPVVAGIIAGTWAFGFYNKKGQSN
jgi:uncharacterized membrane protein YedE/YeeE